MKNRYIPILLIFGVSLILFISGEDKKNTTKIFDKQAEMELKRTAIKFSGKEYKKGRIQPNTYIKISGEIIQSDSKKTILKKGDRFILKNSNGKFQVFNEQNKVLSVGDKVVVYGEYYGYIKSMLIERDVTDD